MCAVTQGRCLQPGPVEEAVRALLPSEARNAKVTTRSPLGANALKVDVDEDPRAVARALERESWVEGVAIRPRHLYLRVGTESLICWLAERSANWTRGQHCGLDNDIAAIPLESAMSMTEFRSVAVRKSLQALYDQREPVERATFVGKVDVRNGPLRMRCGGQVQAADIEEEILALLEKSGSSGSATDAVGAASLAFLSTSRTKHIRVDEHWVKRAVEVLSDLQDIDSTEGEAIPEERVRALAFELNLLPRNAGLAREKADPVYVARSLHAIVRGLRDLPRNHPLRPPARLALDLSLALLAPGWNLGSDLPSIGNAR
jgi:hypothetical protein